MNIEKFQTLSQTQAHTKTSQKYSLIPTSRVISVLQDHGWHPAKVQEARAKEGNRGFQKHIVRLRQESGDLRVGDSFPEIVLINSHMGSSSFQLMLGMFRLVCSNGMVVGDTFEDYRIRHVGYTDEAVEKALQSLVYHAPRAIESVNTFKGIELSQPERLAYAQSVIELVKGEDETYSIEPRDMLSVRRYDDAKNDLWTTFNVAQENVIRGGVRKRGTSYGQRRRTGAINSIDKNVTLNRALWTLTEKMAELRASH